MNYKIGVFGSAVQEKELTRELAKQIGVELGKQNVIVITGASSGIPYIAASEAAKHGSQVWGFSPSLNLAMHKKMFPDLDHTIFKKIIYIPKDYEFSDNDDVCKKYRNVTTTATVDAGIIIAGRWGTLNEFTNLVDMGKVVGVLTETGGVAEELVTLTQRIKKDEKAPIIFNSSPKKLIEDVILALK